MLNAPYACAVVLLASARRGRAVRATSSPLARAAGREGGGGVCVRRRLHGRARQWPCGTDPVLWLECVNEKVLECAVSRCVCAVGRCGRLPWENDVVNARSVAVARSGNANVKSL